MVIISARRRRTRPAVLLYIKKRRDKLLLTTAIPKIFLGFPDKQTNNQQTTKQMKNYIKHKLRFFQDLN
jgi:hypothetical protein